MRKKNFKGRCEKRSLEKFTTICKTYDPIQSAYANILVKNKDIAEVRCNVILDDDCSEYMTDFVCTKTNGDLMVRECISRKLLTELADKDIADKILQCLHELDEPYKEVFTLHALGDIPLTRISQLFGKSDSWARVTYYRAKAIITSKLKEGEK